MRIVDISKIDFDKLKDIFRRNRKNTVTESLVSAIESRLSQMVNLNRTRIDYLEKFQKMIDEYNSGACDKDAFFENLMKFIKDLKRCIAHSYLERSHLGLFFKLFYRAFAKCPEKIGDIESLYRELQPLSLLKIYLVERL